ncbi:MAG: YggT family protein [Treponema sp.]|nr:YggT family protein [Treponema sp.]
MHISTILNILATLISIYALLCFIRVILTWLPSLAYSRATRFLSSICDPFIDRFRHKKWLTLGNFDFGPAVALCILGAASSILSGIAAGGSLSFGILLAYILEMAWQIVSSIITFIIILFAIRLIIILARGDNSYASNSVLYYIDSSISAVAYGITNTFTGGKKVSYKVALITAIIALIILNVVGNIAINSIARLIQRLPF